MSLTGDDRNTRTTEAATNADDNDNDEAATSSKAFTTDDDAGLPDDTSLMEVLAKLSARDSKEVEARTRRHRHFLTDGVVPQVAAGLVAAAEAQPENIFEFLAEHLIRRVQG